MILALRDVELGPRAEGYYKIRSSWQLSLCAGQKAKKATVDYRLSTLLTPRNATSRWIWSNCGPRPAQGKFLSGQDDAFLMQRWVRQSAIEKNPKAKKSRESRHINCFPRDLSHSMHWPWTRSRLDHGMNLTCSCRQITQKRGKQSPNIVQF